MGGAEVAAGESILNRANIPTFAYPDTAAAHVHQHVALRLQPAPALRDAGPRRRGRCRAGPTRRRRRPSSRRPRRAGRTLLTECESKQLLAAYGIPTVPTRVADTRRRGGAARPGEIGYPVVLKLHSETITHKTDVGGVQLNLADADAVRAACARHRAVGDPSASAPDTSRA